MSKSELRMVIEMYDNSHFEGARDALILELLYATGIRRAELLSLTLDSIDRNNQQSKVVGKRKEELFTFLTKVISQIDIYLSYRNLIDQAKPSDCLLINAKVKRLSQQKYINV